MVIYKITNLINGKMYIGKTTTTIEKRWKLHVKHALKERRRAKMCCAIRKYGEHNFSIVEISETAISNSDLNILEKEYIKKYNSTDHDFGYNMTDGGDGGFTEEMRKKSGEARKGLKLSKEHLKKIQEGRKKKGYHVSEKQKQQISITLKHKWKNDKSYRKRMTKINQDKALKGASHPMYDKQHTQVAREKMSAARKSKSYEEIYGEEKAKEIKEQKSKKSRGKNNPNYKDILSSILFELHTNPTLTTQELAEAFDCSRPTISKRLKAVGIDNLQKFRYNKTKEKLKEIFGELHESMVSVRS